MKSKKNAGRILSIALLLVFALTTFGVEAAAMETEVTPRYQFPYIPQDYYPVKIEYIDAPDEIKFSTDLEWADFVNSWNLSKADEQPIENWVFRLTFGHVFPEKVPSRASKGKKRSIEVIVGENTILVDGIYYSCPDNKKLIELLVARWNRAPLID